MKPITWRDLEAPRRDRSMRHCAGCGTPVIYRVADRTYYRTDAGRRPIRCCSTCGRSLYRRNLAN